MVRRKHFGTYVARTFASFTLSDGLIFGIRAHWRRLGGGGGEGGRVRHDGTIQDISLLRFIKW